MYLLKISFLNFFLAFCIFSISAIASADIIIGADFGLSGSVARYGEWVTRGVNLAVNHVNKHGGIIGEPIKIIYEDNQGAPAQAVSAFQKLSSLEKVKFILTYQSSIALAVAPLANKHHIVQMDVSAFSPSYSTPNDFTF